MLIETGYDRSLPYGQPAPFRLIPIINPVTLTVDLAAAVQEGIDAALNDIGVPSAIPAPVAPAQVAPSDPSMLTATKLVEAPTPTASLTNLDSKLKASNTIGTSSTTLAATKPARPKIRGPIGSELENGVKDLTSALTGGFTKPPTAVKTTTGGEHTDAQATGTAGSAGGVAA